MVFGVCVFFRWKFRVNLLGCFVEGNKFFDFGLDGWDYLDSWSFRVDDNDCFVF